MKEALNTCAIALNPTSPQPTASMVKIERRTMIGYGGTFCIRYPVSYDIGCCFNPKAVLAFFRKDRKKFSCTVKNEKLILQEGKEKVTTRCMPPEEMVTIDVLSTPHECTLDRSLLKRCVDAVDPAHHAYVLQGVAFRYGCMEATDAKVLVSALSGVPEEVPEFILPVDSAKALCRIKGSVVGVAVSTALVKFLFDTGASLTSGIISGEFPDMSKFFEGEWEPLGLEAAAPDMEKIDCDRFEFRDGVIKYVVMDQNGTAPVAEGELPQPCNPLNGILHKRICGHLLANSHDIRMTGARLFQSFSDNCRVIGCGML